MLYIRYLITGLIILLLSIAIVPLMSISQITPDLMLIFVVYVALKNGQIAGSVAGFISGLLLDYTVDFTPGLSALSKTICGFIAGFFYDESKIDVNTETFRFPQIVFLCSVVNNAVYFSVDILGREFETGEIIKMLIGGAIYTTILSLVPIFATSRRSRLL